MKKALLFGLMVLLMATSVMAFDWVPKIHTLKQADVVDKTMEIDRMQVNEMCSGEDTLLWEQDNVQTHEAFKEGLDLFKDGYIVFHFTEHDYQGEEYFTAYKKDRKVHWVKKGLCAQTYQYYSTDLDVEELQNDMLSRYRNGGEIDYLTEGYKILTHIRGITFMQKVGIVKIGLRYSGLWQ